MLRTDLTALEEQFDFEVLSVTSVAGGDINDAFKLQTSAGPLFIKANSADQAQAMFSAEADGLTLLSRNGLTTPKILGTGLLPSGGAFLILEYVDSIPVSRESAERAGRALACLHTTHSSTFGYSRNNFIGTIHQSNTPSESWPDFFAKHRIEPLMADTATILGTQVREMWTLVRSRLNELIPCDRPSPLHGDLWGGNLMYSQAGPVFIDPAVCFGDHLMDIAMSRLFGGFPAHFYEAYYDVIPTSKDVLEVKIPLYQLYYLLVHVALFGRSYVPAVDRTLRRFA